MADDKQGLSFFDTTKTAPLASGSEDAGMSFFSKPATVPTQLEPPKPTLQPPTEDEGGLSFFSTPAKPVSFPSEGTDKPQGLSFFDRPASSLSELDQPTVPPALQDNSEAPDPNAPWYKKLWETANAPLFDEKKAKDWFGWDVDHWNGWGKGLFDLASGLTSPLSIALAVGTFGTGSLFEAGGMAALKGVMSAEEIGEVVKGSEVLSKAIKMGHDADTAYAVMPKFGINPEVVKNGLDVLAKSGMKAESLIANGIVRRTGGAMLRSVGYDAATADKVSNWAQFALDAGFSAQNAYGAVVAAPQVLDAIKAGDYESAKRLAVDALGSGAFAVLGGKAIHQHAGELMTDVEAATGLRVKPSDENVKLIKMLEPIERERVIAGEREKQWEQAARKQFNIKPDPKWIAGGSSESDLRARFYRESEGELGAWHDAIAEAAGRPDDKITEDAVAKEEPSEHYDLQKMSSEERHDFINKNINLRLQATDASAAKAELAKLSSEGMVPKSFNTKVVSYTDAKGDVKFGAKWIPKTIAEASNINAPDDVARLQEAASQKLFGKSYKDLDPTNIKDRLAALNEATRMQNEERAAKVEAIPLQKLFPPDIQDAIDSAKIKDKPKEYIDQLLKATDPRLLTDNEKEYAKHTGLHFDETGTRAVGEEVLHDMAESYVTRVFKDPDNDSIRKFRSVATSPDFSVNTAMARKRIYQTTLEGLLKGHELADHDMIALAAHNGNEFSRISSQREALRRLLGAGIRASDGRIMAALSGAGHVVESYDDNGNPVDPAVLINPKGMQSIRMADKVAQGLIDNVVKVGDEGKYAYRLRNVGEQGVKSEGHAQLTTHFPDMGRWWESRSTEPQEMVRVPIDKLSPQDYTMKPGPNGGNWLTLTRDLNESELEKLPKNHIPKATVTELDKLIKEGRVVRYGQDKRTGKDLYAWTTNDYRTINHPAFKGWKVPTTDTDGNPVYVQGELRVHPDAFDYLNKRFADEGIVKKIPGLKAGLKAAREAKGLLLAFSPFHIVQEGLRAVMTGISPIGNERFNPNNPMHVLAAEKGVWEFKNYRGVQAFEDGLVGHSKLISKVPVLRDIQSYTQSLLFDRYIPGLKLRAFERMYEANKGLHPEWTKEKIANETADEVNERFGGIPYKRIGRAAATMDVARLTTLAPDWLESEMRFMKRIFSGDEGALARRDMLKMTMGMWAVARVINYLTTGKLHNEAPFGVVHKDSDGREKIYSMRTMPGDMLHAISDPLGFMNGRIAPLVKTGIQTYTGRDEFGRKMDTNGIFVNLLRNVAPIGAQTAVKTATGEYTGGITNLDQAAKAAGLTVYPFRTEAQKLAAKIASDHAESGLVDKTKLARHQYIIDLEDKVRQGVTPITDVYRAVETGQLHVDEAKRLQKNIQETAGMDHEMARLYMHASRLPFADLIKVWNAAGNDEKAALSKLLIKGKTAYLKKVYKEMAPAERDSDPSYLWIKKNFPGQAPF